MNTHEKADYFARYAMAVDSITEAEAPNMRSQLAACIVEVLETFPTAKLSYETAHGEYYLQAESGFMLANETKATQAWFAAHADWTPCATLD